MEYLIKALKKQISILEANNMICKEEKTLKKNLKEELEIYTLKYNKIYN